MIDPLIDLLTFGLTGAPDVTGLRDVTTVLVVEFDDDDPGGDPDPDMMLIEDL